MIRGRFGRNNNPSALEFRSAYKQLLVRNEVKSKQSGNYTPLTNVPLLSWSKDMSDNNNMFDPVIFSESRTYDTPVNDEPTSLDPQEIYLDMPMNLSDYIENIVVYISGFVSRRLKDAIKSSICSNALFN